MKWRLYDIPEFMKVLTCKTVMDSKDKKLYDTYRKFEYGMYVFTDWVANKLDDIYKREEEKFVPGEIYKVPITSRYEEDTIREFSQFYIRMRRNPMGGKCEYADVINEYYPDIHPGIGMECFEFVNRPIKYKDMKTLAFVIVGFHDAKFSIDKKEDKSYVSIQCIAYK